jgi:hypothetical protein
VRFVKQIRRLKMKYRNLQDLIGDVNSFIFNLFPSLDEVRGDKVVVEKEGVIMFELEFKWNPEAGKKMYALKDVNSGEISWYDKLPPISKYILQQLNNGKLVLYKDELPVAELEFELTNFRR